MFNNKIGNSFRICLDGEVEKWEDGKYLVFLFVCLVGVVEKWDDENSFVWLKKKRGMMKNVIYIN